MAPLVAQLEEGADLMQLEGVECIRAPVGWDWSTVAIFTCSKSCKGGTRLADEFIVAAEACIAAPE